MPFIRAPFPFTAAIYIVLRAEFGRGDLFMDGVIDRNLNGERSEMPRRSIPARMLGAIVIIV